MNKGVSAADPRTGYLLDNTLGRKVMSSALEPNGTPTVDGMKYETGSDHQTGLYMKRHHTPAARAGQIAATSLLIANNIKLIVSIEDGNCEFA